MTTGRWSPTNDHGTPSAIADFRQWQVCVLLRGAARRAVRRVGAAGATAVWTGLRPLPLNWPGVEPTDVRSGRWAARAGDRPRTSGTTPGPRVYTSPSMRAILPPALRSKPAASAFERIWLAAAVEGLASVVPVFREQPVRSCPTSSPARCGPRCPSEVEGGRVGQRLAWARGRQPDVGASLWILGNSP